MRFALFLATLVVAGSATAGAQTRDGETSRNPPVTFRQGSVILPTQDPACRDRIHTAREERGLPAREQGTADPHEPLMIKALDQRLDGCSVMVMHHDSMDIRLLPRAHEPRLMPAR